MKLAPWALALGCLALSATLLAADARGGRSCRKWLEERGLAEGNKEMNRVPVLISKGWFLGFMAGRTNGSNRDPLAGIDDESLFLWLDGYCRDHLQGDLANAGLALERELTAGKTETKVR